MFEISDASGGGNTPLALVTYVFRKRKVMEIYEKIIGSDY